MGTQIAKGSAAEIMHFYIRVDKAVSEGFYDCKYGYVQHDDKFQSKFLPLSLTDDSAFVDYIVFRLKRAA